MPNDLIDDFIDDICDFLVIPKPKISFDTSMFKTSTTLAMCDLDTIYIKKIDKPNPDLLFSIAHELRHMWQLKNHENDYFTDYRQSFEIGTEAYNLQPAEIDANAFASVVMVDFLVCNHFIRDCLTK